MRRRRRNHRRGKNHTVRNIIIGCFVMTFLFVTGYSAFSTNITLNVKGNIKEKSRIIRSWTYDSVDDFHNIQYRENIASVTFLNTREIPANVEKSWDVSADKKGGVIAYVKINEEDHTKYDLFIGAKDGVIANENSSWIFYNFINVISISFNNNYDTSKTINMTNMFNKCENLLSLDINSFDTSKVTTMYGMFANCFRLNNLNCNKINTVSVNDMSHMFSNLRNLSILDITNFNTENVKSMVSMFYKFGSNNLQPKVLDLSNFDTKNVTNTKEMFYGCQSLYTIYVSDKFVTTNVIDSTDMFTYDIHLVGENGTTYNSSYIDKTYARIDTASTPGYFTLKQ